MHTDNDGNADGYRIVDPQTGKSYTYDEYINLPGNTIRDAYDVGRT
jgi:hypothetical protein